MFTGTITFKVKKKRKPRKVKRGRGSVKFISLVERRGIGTGR